MAITKARFILDTLRHLEATAKEFKASGTTNGNAINAVIRKVEKASYESGLFDTGELSAHMLEGNGNPARIQDSPNWREIFMGYLK